jgi:hypothetical protein
VEVRLGALETKVDSVARKLTLNNELPGRFTLVDGRIPYLPVEVAG